MNRSISAAFAAALLVSAAPLAAQTSNAAPAGAAPAAVQQIVLPAGTQVLLATSTEINSTQNRAGDTFPLTVAQDVRVGDIVVIPRGSRAVGEITWRTGRGAFGKSGKMNFAIRYVELDGVRVPLLGTFRQEGEGATLATMGAVVLVGVFGGFVTGSRARVPAGRELTVTLAEALPALSPAHAGGPARIDPSYRPSSPQEVAAVEAARVRTVVEQTCTAQHPGRGGQQQARRCVQRAMRDRGIT